MVGAGRYADTAADCKLRYLIRGCCEISKAEATYQKETEETL